MDAFCVGRFAFNKGRQRNYLVNNLIGGDMVSTRVSKFEVHAERVVTLVKQSL